MHHPTPPPTVAESAPVPPLTVRRLHIDLNQGFGRHWNGGSAFRTAYANALSMSFPLGEQFFIESVQKGLALLPNEPHHQSLREQIKGFIGQEATHRHLHARFNQILSEQGLVNTVQERIRKRIDWGRKLSAKASPRSQALYELAVTAAYEHYTAVFGEETLAVQNRAGDWFLNAEPALKTLWHWHASEETEHKAIAFDLYTALGGNHAKRVRWFLFVTLIFSIDTLRQTVRNLWHDGTLFSPRTWRDAASFMLGRQGALWRCFGPSRQYLKRDFHPNSVGRSQLAHDWLAQNQATWTAVQTHTKP